MKLALWILLLVAWAHSLANEDFDLFPGPPYMDGTEQQQADFAEFSYHITRQAGASGWSWWAFQDFRFVSHGTDPDDLPIVHQNYYGAMRYGGPIIDPWEGWPAFEKPIADKIRNFTYIPRQEPPGAYPGDEVYTNPWNFSTSNSWQSGTVIELHSQAPVANGVAFLWSVRPRELGYLFPDGHQALYKNVPLWSYNEYYTGSYGYFNFYEDDQIIGGWGPPIRKHIAATSIGGSSKDGGEWGVYNSEHVFAPPGSLYAIELHPYHWNWELRDAVIYSEVREPLYVHHGRTFLLVENVQVDPAPDPGATQVDLSARYAVHVLNDFHAAVGTEVHIFIQDEHPACIDPSLKHLSPSQYPAIESSVTRLTSHEPPRMELSFEPILSRLTVDPNPFMHSIWIRGGFQGGEVMYSVTDGSGRLVAEGWLTSEQLNLQQLAPGGYILSLASLQRKFTTTQIVKLP